MISNVPPEPVPPELALTDKPPKAVRSISAPVELSCSFMLPPFPLVPVGATDIPPACSAIAVPFESVEVTETVPPFAPAACTDTEPWPLPNVMAPELARVMVPPDPAPVPLEAPSALKTKEPELGWLVKLAALMLRVPPLPVVPPPSALIVNTEPLLLTSELADIVKVPPFEDPSGKAGNELKTVRVPGVLRLMEVALGLIAR